MGTHGEGTFETLKSGKIRMRITVMDANHVRHRKSFTGRSKAECRRLYAQYLQNPEPQKEQVPIEKVKLVKDAAMYWVDMEHKPPEGSKKGWGNYKNYLGVINNHIIPAFGNLPVTEVQTAHIKELKKNARTRPTKKHPQGQPMGVAGIRYILLACKGIFDYCVENDLRETNPAAKVPLPGKELKPPAVWPKNAMKHIQDYFHVHEYGPYLAIYFYSGIRKSEGIGLMWSDIDFEKGLFYLRRSLSKTDKGYEITEGTKTKVERVAAYNQALAPLLEKIPRKSVYVNPRMVIEYSPIGEQIETYTHHTHESYDRMHYKFIDDLNATLPEDEQIPRLSPKQTRHTAATGMRRAGVDLHDVAIQLGHTNISTTQIYDEVDIDDQRTAVNKLAF